MGPKRIVPRTAPIKEKSRPMYTGKKDWTTSANAPTTTSVGRITTAFGETKYTNEHKLKTASIAGFER
ncbi:MAG: hypothetical protein KAI53_01600 [Candidatus Aenigmarchaeota archaeon]|nr:hypothetical protein [Candidatus Aenigmarchaeota archaeon]